MNLSSFYNEFELFYLFQVYSWGTEDQGKLGRPIDQNDPNINDPITKHLTADRVRGIIEMEEAVKIACGAHFSVVVLKDDSVCLYTYIFFKVDQF